MERVLQECTTNLLLPLCEIIMEYAPLCSRCDAFWDSFTCSECNANICCNCAVTCMFCSRGYDLSPLLCKSEKCTTKCQMCKKFVCNACVSYRCAECEMHFCDECIEACQKCDITSCNACGTRCRVCSLSLCHACEETCPRCNIKACTDCVFHNKCCGSESQEEDESSSSEDEDVVSHKRYRRF